MPNGFSVRRGAGSAPFVTTEIDPVTGAMFARNAWNSGFGSRVAFVDLQRRRKSDWTGDRREFIGRNGTLASPAALAGATPLSKTAGAGLDPCGALRTTVELPPNGTVEIVFFLGEAASAEEARSLIARYRTADLDAVLSDVARYWDDVLGAVQVKTPDRPMDIMLNGWLLYQTLACRIWARSAFYQASGAYGFRDQLQDGMALVASATGDDARALAAGGGAAIRRRRRAALVAAAFRPGRAHADFRRPSMARLRGRPLCRRDGRCRRSGRGGSLPGGPEAGGGRARQLLPAHRLRRDRHAVRALRARPRPKPRARRPRPAADRHRRLERRDEPRRRTGRGRERLARLASVRGADGLRSARRGPPRDGPRRDMARARRRAAETRSSARHGTATGIGAAGSTTARRSARRRARNAGSIPSRSPGR